jgi:hypothetical protein
MATARSYTFEKSRINVVFGDISLSTAQVIVSSDDYYITMGGGVSGARIGRSYSRSNYRSLGYVGPSTFCQTTGLANGRKACKGMGRS